ncbi:hypothetical protein EVAR_30000_1 [Eumeta japonica]|uniref:Uncharacterized protein n=1 Tax=Eumeta variegata TaxID=151549 RepID=A0A4C1VWZ8_EUMVA|nr:hypothetical protein EVAR_30000_1 [Eumeta japonica]
MEAKNHSSLESEYFIAVARRCFNGCTFDPRECQSRRNSERRSAILDSLWLSAAHAFYERRGADIGTAFRVLALVLFVSSSNIQEPAMYVHQEANTSIQKKELKIKPEAEKSLLDTV